MSVFLNGKFVPEDRAMVSVFDRGFLYGDALFEGVLVTRGQPFRWTEHMERLQRGVEFLKLTVPYSYDALRQYALRLIVRNQMPECLLRLSITRGITARGYSPQNATQPAVVMTLHALQALDGKSAPRWRVITSSFRLPSHDPLANFKTANKLIQVLARAEADAVQAQEAILLNTEGQLAEGTTSNLFWITKDAICTPPLAAGALPGVTRAVMMELFPCRERAAGLDELRRADGAFLTMTSMGVVEIESLDGRKLKRSSLVKKIGAAYRDLQRAS
ncbi:MAG TPA: aminotransferase class IV [Candidatus Saccharimonadales bacterium]|nr:aminotransferase class IV [Candidatus Saccharimonadales bacterium]